MDLNWEYCWTFENISKLVAIILARIVTRLVLFLISNGWFWVIKITNNSDVTDG